MADADFDKGLRYRFADIDLVPRQRCVMRGARHIAMGSLSYDLLELLVTRAPEIVTKSQCLDLVWHGRVVGAATLTQRIRLLRRALSDSSSAPKYIELVRGSGYRILPAVHAKPDAPRRQRSLAVLPFENLSTNPRDEYFATGVYEEVVSELCKLDDVEVLARQSLDKVDGVIRGCIRYANGRMRISARLVDTLHGTHVWADTFDFEHCDDFDVQSKVAQSIALGIGARH